MTFQTTEAGKFDAINQPFHLIPLQKCDGALPHCGRCLKTENPQCRYDDLKVTLEKRSLPKGEACIPCR